MTDNNFVCLIDGPLNRVVAFMDVARWLERFDRKSAGPELIEACRDARAACMWVWQRRTVAV